MTSGRSATKTMSLDVKRIKWPVYRLPGRSTPLLVDGNLVLKMNKSANRYMVDPKALEAQAPPPLVEKPDNIPPWITEALIDTPKTTLLQRRLRYPSSDIFIRTGYKLVKLRYPVFRFTDLIQKPKGYYVDSNGKAFLYSKSVPTKLRYHKIKKYTRCPIGWVLHVHGIAQPFLRTKEPDFTCEWASILHIGRGYILYGIEPTYNKEVIKYI